MASQNPQIIAQDVLRVVSLFVQAGHAVSTAADLKDVPHEAPAGAAFPAGEGGWDAIFTADRDGLARIAFSLSAVAAIKLTESADGGENVVTHTLNEGDKLQGDLLTWPVRKGYRYAFQLGDAVSLYSLVIDLVRE